MNGRLMNGLVILIDIQDRRTMNRKCTTNSALWENRANVSLVQKLPENHSDCEHTYFMPTL